MDVDPLETVESLKRRAAEAGRARRLNAAVAISVALLATFMAICKVKDDNICQAMQQAQADKLDHWSFYQARNIRQEVAEGTLAQLQALRQGMAAGATAAIDEMIQHQQKLATEQQQKKTELRAQAEADQKQYDALNFRDDQFDLADALLAIAVALLAMTALTELWWLFCVAMLPTFFGVLMGLAGLAGWPIHPTALVQLLS
ncbi:MAG: DUF4337 domain-containing protein [Burkholderiaceae bacterium]